MSLGVGSNRVSNDICAFENLWNKEVTEFNAIHVVAEGAHHNED